MAILGVVRTLFLMNIWRNKGFEVGKTVYYLINSVPDEAGEVVGFEGMLYVRVRWSSSGNVITYSYANTPHIHLGESVVKKALCDAS